VADSQLPGIASRKVVQVPLVDFIVMLRQAAQSQSQAPPSSSSSPPSPKGGKQTEEEEEKQGGFGTALLQAKPGQRFLPIDCFQAETAGQLRSLGVGPAVVVLTGTRHCRGDGSERGSGSSSSSTGAAAAAAAAGGGPAAGGFKVSARLGSGVTLQDALESGPSNLTSAVPLWVGKNQVNVMMTKQTAENILMYVTQEEES
jgi:hypothetical protein